MTTISFFPIIAEESELFDVISRAAWFLAFCPVDRIYLPVASDELTRANWRVAPGMDPAIARNFGKLRTKLEIAVTRTEADLDACMSRASIILHWRKGSKPDFVSANKLASWQQGRKVWQVDPVTVRMEGSFYIDVGLHLLPNKASLIEENRNKFERLATKLGRFERAYLMATGPSVERYKKFDYTGALGIVCNSIVLDEDLMDTVRPQIVTFADAIFHFGPSQYAASFRATLLASANKHDYAICIPFKYYGLFVSMMPELASRTIGIPFTKDRPFNFDIVTEFETKTTANILTLLMVPLATTFADEVGFLGCDGRPLKDNNYFWKHNPSTQFNDKMANIREVHPGFFNIDYNDYYLEHCETLEKQFVDGERRGNRFLSLGFSHIPALSNRLDRGKRVHAASQSKDAATVLIVDPDAKTWAGHYMAYNEKLCASLRDLGADVRVICRKDLDPGILSQRPHYVPVLTDHSWEVGNRSENQSHWSRFAQEISGVVERLSRQHPQILLYMYCGGIEHAKTLLELTRKHDNLHVNINLFWLSFKISKEWCDIWRPSLDILDATTPRFVATVPTRELQTELAEQTGCLLDVAPHPSTGISDAQFGNIPSSEPWPAPESTFTVLFPSAPRPEKGYSASLECIRLLGRRPNLRLLVRHAPIASTPPALSRAPQGMPDNATVVQGSLSDDEFLKLFEQSHIAVLPYTGESFAKRTSGLLIDAIYHQIPCVVVEGTWLSRMVQHYGCGVIVPAAVAEKLADGVEEIAKHYKHYRQRAAAAGKDYFLQNSWRNLGQFLLGRAQAPTASRWTKANLVTTDRVLVGPSDRNTRAHWDETHCIAQLFSTSLSGSTMIDVGAHHGSALARFLNKGWRVFAFEPDDSNRRALQAYLSKHQNASLVSLDNRAVSNRSEGTRSFYSSDLSTGISGLSAFHPSHRKTQEVDTVTLRKALPTHSVPSIDFLKIDTEGHDLFVLQGFPWERFKPAVIECEFEDSKTVPLGYTFHDLARYLTDRGYSVYVSEWHPVVRYGIRHDWNRLVRYPCELAEERSWGNLLAFRDGIDETKLIEAVRKVLSFGPPVTKPAASPQARVPLKAPEPAKLQPSRNAHPSQATTLARSTSRKSDCRKISIITPNYNGEKFLEKTIVSVLSQDYPNLEYIIVDGKSTDASMRIVDKYRRHFAHVISEPDKGHADALNKGFALVSGEVMGWVNSDDMLLPRSLDLLNDVFSRFPDVDWITGRSTNVLESDVVHSVRQARPWSWLRFLCGDYRHIQQESTFWRRRLWERAGGGLSLRYSLANDFELWTRFFRHAPLYTVDRLVGCFRDREGQRSRLFAEQYDKECDEILAELLGAIPVRLLAKYLYLLPAQRVLHPSHDFPNVPAALAVADPPIIRFDEATQSFSRPDFSPLVPSAYGDCETRKEDLGFKGLERVSWIDGPDFGSHELTGLEVELRGAQPFAESNSGFSDFTPPMPLLAGPVALYQMGSRTYYIQISYVGTVIGHAIAVDNADTRVRVKVALASGRYAIVVNGKTLAVGQLAGQQLAQSRHAKIGGGYLSRYWAGTIERLVVTFQSRSAGTSDSQSRALIHQEGARSSPRERRQPAIEASAAKPSYSGLRHFKDFHKGQRCFVVGNGPSLNKMDLEKLRDEIVFACNGVFLLFDRISWRPRYYTCVDSRVIRDRAADIVRMLEEHPKITSFFPSVLHLHDGSDRTFEGRSIIPPKANRYYFNEVFNSLSNPPSSMFSLDIDRYVVQPYTVAITMLQLAAYMGFSEIYLIGCDTDYKVPSSVKQEGQAIDDVGLLLTSTKDDDPNHFDARYFGKGREWHNPQVDKMIEHHQWAYEALKHARIRVFNATVGGRLEVYPRVDFDSLFAKTSSEQRLKSMLSYTAT